MFGSLYQMMFIAGNAARTYIVYRILDALYKEQSQKKVYMKSGIYIGYFFMITLAAFINNPSPLMAGKGVNYFTTDIHASDTVTMAMCISEVAGVLIITFLYERNPKKNILTAAGVFAIFRGTEAVVFWYIRQIYNIKMFSIERTALFRLIVSTMLIYAIVFTLISIRNMQNGCRHSFLYRLCILLTPCVIYCFLFEFLSIIFYQIEWYNMETKETFDLMSWYYKDEKIMLFLFLACLWFFWLYDFIIRSQADVYEKILLKKENQYYERQLKNMEQSISAWKSIHHDLKNHFIVLKGMLDWGEEEQAKTYLDEFIMNELENKREVRSGNTAIDSILNYKILEAEQHTITFDLEIQIPEQLPVSPKDMSVILGNAIDNAIEAVEKTEEKYICLLLQYTKGRLLIQISNPYAGELKMGASGEYLTGKTEKEYHGFGLKNIRDTVEKYGGVMDINAKDRKFTLTILLYL